MSGYNNYYKRTVGDFFRDVRTDGLDATIEDRKAWGRMRMTPTDMSDVNAHTYTYLMNGTSALGNWTGLRSEEHTSELQSLMRISYAVFYLKEKSEHINSHKSTIHY